MTMTMNGLAKLTEELGELQQVVGKMMAYGTGAHPDGTESLLKRFEEESADVVAAMTFVGQTHGADGAVVKRRSAMKLALFQQWHTEKQGSHPGGCRTCDYAGCEVRDSSDMSLCPSHSALTEHKDGLT